MKSKKVLIACEHSGTVRDAFRAMGHEAYSCDLLPDTNNSPFHIQGDALKAIKSQAWDLIIAHPPCTYLSVSDMHWTTRGLRDPKLTEDALQFVRDIIKAAGNTPLVIENPVSVISTKICKPTQIIQPFEFGHPESKKTCLWIFGNLPKLEPTNELPLPKSGRWENQTPSGQNKLAPSKDRWAKRSKTYTGIAAAMAEQWGDPEAYAARKEFELDYKPTHPAQL